MRRAFGCQSHHDQVARLYFKQPFKCQFRPFKAPKMNVCVWKGKIPGLKGQIVNICRRTEELQVVRELDYGIQQFVSQIVNEPPPYHQSLWLSSDGYFYTLSLAPAEISHKNFKSGSWILKAWGCEGKKLKLVCHLVQIKPQLLFFSLLITLTALEPSPGRSHQRELLRSERGLAIHEQKGCDMPVGWNDRRRLWLLPQWL